MGARSVSTSPATSWRLPDGSEDTEMEVEIKREGTLTVVAPAGDIVAEAVPELKSRLLELVHSGVRELTIDLSGTYMMDSVGIGLLLSAYNSMRSAGGRFAVIHASDELMDLLRSLR